MKIIDYGIILQDNTANLSKEVCRAIDNDYQPLGGVAYLKNGKCAQAVIKYEATE